MIIVLLFSHVTSCTMEVLLNITMSGPIIAKAELILPTLHSILA